MWVLLWLIFTISHAVHPPKLTEQKDQFNLIANYLDMENLAQLSKVNRAFHPLLPSFAIHNLSLLIEHELSETVLPIHRQRALVKRVISDPSDVYPSSKDWILIAIEKGYEEIAQVLLRKRITPKNAPLCFLRALEKRYWSVLEYFHNVNLSREYQNLCVEAMIHMIDSSLEEKFNETTTKPFAIILGWMLRHPYPVQPLVDHIVNTQFYAVFYQINRRYRYRLIPFLLLRPSILLEQFKYHFLQKDKDNSKNVLWMIRAYFSDDIIYGKEIFQQVFEFMVEHNEQLTAMSDPDTAIITVSFKATNPNLLDAAKRWEILQLPFRDPVHLILKFYYYIVSVKDSLYRKDYESFKDRTFYLMNKYLKQASKVNNDLLAFQIHVCFRFFEDANGEAEGLLHTLVSPDKDFDYKTQGEAVFVILFAEWIAEQTVRGTITIPPFLLSYAKQFLMEHGMTHVFDEIMQRTRISLRQAPYTEAILDQLGSLRASFE